MKYALAVMALSLAACSAPTAPAVPLPKNPKPAIAPLHDTECGSCTDAFGRSGYTVNLGRCEAC